MRTLRIGRKLAEARIILDNRSQLISRCISAPRQLLRSSHALEEGCRHHRGGEFSVQRRMAVRFNPVAADVDHQREWRVLTFP
ncbi:hypothetical protein CO659_05195 [Rhizobium sp. S9]|nr:hypothetical protein CO659_05195 [Rhizobium sp. S9]